MTNPIDSQPPPENKPVQENNPPKAAPTSPQQQSGESLEQMALKFSSLMSAGSLFPEITSPFNQQQERDSGGNDSRGREQDKGNKPDHLGDSKNASQDTQVSGDAVLKSLISGQSSGQDMASSGATMIDLASQIASFLMVSQPKGEGEESNVLMRLSSGFLKGTTIQIGKEGNDLHLQFHPETMAASNFLSQNKEDLQKHLQARIKQLQVKAENINVGNPGSNPFDQGGESRSRERRNVQEEYHG